MAANAILNLILPALLAGAAAGDSRGLDLNLPCEDSHFGTQPSCDVVVRSVHGPVAFWNGTAWARLRPNMIFSNNPTIRPGPESSVDLSAGPEIIFRLVSDRALKVTAFVVKRKAPGACDGDDSGASAPPLALQIEAGNVLRGPGEIEFGVLANGDVEVKSGEVTVRGDGKTHLLEDGGYFAASTGEALLPRNSRRGVSGGTAPRILGCSIETAAQPLLFASGLENARHGACLAGR